MSKITDDLRETLKELQNKGLQSEADNVEAAIIYIEQLVDILRKAYPEKSGHFFISGGFGEKDNNGLPDRIQICPAYGCDFSIIYEKTDHIIGGMGS